MITENIIKRTYIERIVDRDAKIIRDTQSQVIADYYNNGTGRLLNYIKTSHHHVEGIHFMFPVLNYLRFLDINNRNTSRSRRFMMAERSNLALYNRVVWGVLYKETLPALKFGFTEDIKRYIRKQLIENTDTQQSIQF